MKKRMIAIVCIVFVACTSLSAKNFTLVYLDRSEVNLEAMKFLNNEIRSQKIGLKPTYVSGFNKLKNTNDPIVILNTGFSSGVDSRITAYMKTVTDKSKYIMLNLYGMQSYSFYEAIPSKDSSVGVDEISSASMEMANHQRWATQLFTLINGK